MLTRLAAAAHAWASVPPWTNVYGLARTLLALSTLSTLLFSSSTSLFRPASGIPDFPHCGGLARASLFCLVPTDHLWLGRLIAILLLLVAASGWRPQLTGVPHWWVAVSFQASSVIPDGGDQLNAILTLLILPIALSDRRRWHWAVPPDPPADLDRAHRSAVIALAAWSAALVIRIQVGPTAPPCSTGYATRCRRTGLDSRTGPGDHRQPGRCTRSHLGSAGRRVRPRPRPDRQAKGAAVPARRRHPATSVDRHTCGLWSFSIVISPRSFCTCAHSTGPCPSRPWSTASG